MERDVALRLLALCFSNSATLTAAERFEVSELAHVAPVPEEEFQ
jgi:hypothetical protein